MEEKTYIEVDELVIGSGLSGLSYGLQSVMDGRNTLICEAKSKVGGYASNFYRNKRKYVFDCSQHYVTGLHDEGNLRYVFEHFGILPSLDIQFREEMLVIMYKKQFISIPSKWTKFREILVNRFPEEKKGIEKMFDDVNFYGGKHNELYKVFTRKGKLDISLIPTKIPQDITALSYYQSLFKDIDLIELICSIAYALGTIPEEESAYHVMLLMFYGFFTSTAYVKGFNGNLSEVMAERFKGYGGDIIFNNPVLSLDIVSDKEWIEIETKKKIIKAKSVVSTCSPNELIKMIGKENLNNSFVKRIDRLEPNDGTFCVYAVSGIPPEQAGVKSFQYTLVNNSLNYYTSQENRSGIYQDDLPIIVNNYYKVAKERGYILQFSLFNDNNDWFKYNKNEYKEKKEEIQNKILERVYEVFPKLRDQLIYIESSTPKTNHRYTLSPKGSTFGYKMVPNKSNSFLITDFPDKRIKICGCWGSAVGYEPSILIGYITAKVYTQQLLKERFAKVFIKNKI